MEDILFAIEQSLSLADEDNISYNTTTTDDAAKHCEQAVQVLPMAEMAAHDGIENLCAIRCEGYALRHFGFDVSDETLIEESLQAKMLTEKGTALHNIGRLAGNRGLSISHRYQCTPETLAELLTEENVVIAAIDGNELLGNYAAEQYKNKTVGPTPNHVVIVNAIEGDEIIITDSATPQPQDRYPIEQFVSAWNDSACYLVIITNSKDYTPHPIQLDDVEVEDTLIDLQEAIAENAHEVWANARLQEGWRFGAERDDARKLHPDIIPFNLLPDSEKEYDRIMAMNTIKLVKKLGWELKKKSSRIVYDEQTFVMPTGFTDTERSAIATLILRLLCANNRISPKGLMARNKIFREFNITYDHQQNLPPFLQACHIYRNMGTGKRIEVLNALHQIAAADGNCSDGEKQLIESIEGGTDL